MVTTNSISLPATVASPYKTALSKPNSTVDKAQEPTPVSSTPQSEGPVSSQRAEPLFLNQEGFQPDEAVAKALEEINRRMDKISNSSIRFETDSESGDIIVRIVDRETEEVIRQIPPEEMIRITESLPELKGMLVNSQG